MATSGKRVVIVGAGLTGLLAAQGLKKLNFDVSVYDAEPHLNARTRDWTIVLHWALPAMRAMLPEAIAAALPEATCNPHLAFDDYAETFVVYSGATGEYLFGSPMPGSRRISRRRLRSVLATGIDVHWGATLQTLADAPDGQEGVVLTFADGTTTTADFVLGADGASSRVRSLVVGPDKAQSTRSGLMFATGIVQYHDASKVAAVVKLHPVAAAAMGTDVVAAVGVMYVDNPDDMTDWTTWWVKIWQASGPNVQGAAALEYVEKNTSKLCHPFQDFVDWTPPGSVCYADEMRYWVPVPFDSHGGRVTLAGDAAHPMLIYRGQGFQHAITDVENYIKTLVKIRDAAWAPNVRVKEFDAYDADIVSRGATAVTQSVKEAALSFDMEMVSKMTMVRKGHGRSV